MNKNVFNYLNEKANDVADYIKAKAEAAGTYLSEHAQDIKQGAIKGTATVLTAATLLTGMTGCDTLEQIGGPKLEQYEQLPIRPIEEIEQSGITAEDVLALYDDLAEKCVEAHYATTRWKDKLGDRFYDLDGEFLSIAPLSSSEIGFGDNYTLPFYLTSNYFELVNRWSTNTKSEYFTNDTVFDNKDIYRTKITLNANLDDSTENMSFDWGIPKSSLDNVLLALNTPTTTLNREELEGQIPNTYINQIEREMLWGTDAYQSITITKDTIKNANPEQLWALYNLINDMIELNFNGKLPTTDQNLEIIE